MSAGSTFTGSRIGGGAFGAEPVGGDALGRRDPGSVGDAVRIRLNAVIAVAQFHNLALDRQDFRPAASEAVPSPASLVNWLQESGLWAKAVRLRWGQLFRFEPGAPLVLLFSDASAALLVARDATRQVVFLKDPSAPDAPPIAVDELRLAQVWRGEALLVRRARGDAIEDEPFSMGWLARLVLREHRNLRDVIAASISLSVLQIIPPFLIMVAIDKVITHHSMSTLAMIALIMALIAGYETLLGYGRREIVQVLSTRLDARLNIHVFRWSSPSSYTINY